MTEAADALTWVKAMAATPPDTGMSPQMPHPLMHADSPPLTECDIACLVDCFYDKVRRDPMLAPVFNPVVHDWDAHKRLLTAFWCSVALRAGSYRGNPMAMHRSLPIQAQHFEHWLGLWQDTAQSLLPAPQAALMAGYAQSIGRSLRHGLGLDDRLHSPPLSMVGRGV